LLRDQRAAEPAIRAVQLVDCRLDIGCDQGVLGGDVGRRADRIDA
jgi:hypothetical protein